MLLDIIGQELLAWAPAKVNLFLEVIRKRSDGYHDIVSAMIAVSLFDTLRFTEEETGDVSLEISNPALSSGKDNLVQRAAHLLREKTGCNRGVKISLEKRIPMAAGLAGGSSNAAATLAGLNEIWKLGLSNEELAQLGAELGSDVAFFFNPPAAWCTGRGEIVTPLALGNTLWLVLLCPPFGLNTPEVYGALELPEKPVDEWLFQEALQKGDIEKVGSELHNRLQPAAWKLSPQLPSQLECLQRYKPAGQLLSGSGTTLFALCRNISEAKKIAQGLRKAPDVIPGSQVFLVRSC